jgi:hypothetical protein
LVARPTEQDYQSAFITYEYSSGGGSADAAGTLSAAICADGTVTIDDAPYGLPARRLRHDISEQQVRELVDAFYDIDYYSLEDDYQYKRTGLTISGISHSSTVVTSLTTAKREKRVRTYWGAPEELTDLELLLARTVLAPGVKYGVELPVAPEPAQP